MNIIGLHIILSMTLLICGSTEAPADKNPDVIEKSGQLQQQIKMLQVSAMEPNQPVQTTLLRDMISQLQSLQLPKQAGQPAPVQKAAVRDTADSADANQAKSVPQPQTTAAGPAEPNLARLDEVTTPLNAIAAADALYRVGDFARAKRFYDIAAADTPGPANSIRSWAMYQSANCTRKQDPQQAVDLYNKLIAEFPNSTWSSAALVQRKKIEWLKKNQDQLKQRMSGNDPNAL
ncbi:MAG: tetratricopeptide repeat protein [Sedimentisphaerales bacterium]|nr:tetratricopeptide repeat protein [Sedimentisphaerales bacterium]